LSEIAVTLRTLATTLSSGYIPWPDLTPATRRHWIARTWRYEATTFWFEQIKRGVRSYKLDFEVTNRDGSIEYHEVKGWDYARGQTARKRMACHHPTVKLVLIRRAEIPRSGEMESTYP